MLVDAISSPTSNGSRARKLLIHTDTLKQDSILAGDIVRLSVQHSPQQYLFLQAWPVPTLPDNTACLSTSHYASLSLSLPTPTSPPQKLEVRKVNLARLQPSEALSVRLVEVSKPSILLDLDDDEDELEQGGKIEGGEGVQEGVKREDAWLEICLKQALVDQRYLTPSTTLIIDLPSSTRSFRLAEVNGFILASPIAEGVDGLTSALGGMEVKEVEGAGRKVDRMWTVGWGVKVTVEEFEKAESSKGAKGEEKGKKSEDVVKKTQSGTSAVPLPSFINVYPPSTSSTPYASIGGLDSQVALVRSLIDLPLLHPDLFHSLSLPPPRGILLYGPPGTGKTALARAIADSTPGCSCIVVNGPELSGAFHGETEERLRSVWTEALSRSPCVLVLDEIDALCPRRDGGEGGEVERRVVSQLLTLMDGMGNGGKDGKEEGRVVVIGATNRPNAIDPALRRPGRFDKEIEIGVPDATARLSILSTLLRSIPNSIDPQALSTIAGQTHGYVGADLSSLIREAGTLTIQSHLSSFAPSTSSTSSSTLEISFDNLLAALPLVRPSAMREVFLETPSTKWSDIGGQEDVKQKLRECVEWPLKYRSTFERLGVRPPRGVLLYGPPGCSKTLTAKALATESGINFLAVKGPELLNKYVGESERAVREVFRKARAASPSIIFFDEIDALCTSREESESSHTSGILTSILNEMDGVEELVGVTVVAATNRPDVIDSALLRPGRIDRILYVGPPSLESRVEIFKISLGKMAVEEGTCASELAALTEGCSGAEIVQVCQDAALRTMNFNLEAPFVRKEDFVAVIKSIRKSITPDMLRFFEEWRDQSGGRSA